ncbi:MAG: polymerase [Proteobacteria bacterium]|nr:polymerase [Pseudomonadota bacterium]
MPDHRAILHVDMDAFYASVEQRDNPELAGKPVIVGGTGGRGVVAAASYEVRRFGVHSAMPMREALRRCPHAACVRPRMARYKEVSGEVFAVFGEFTDLVQGLSLDEAFLDVTASRRLLGTPETMAREIKRRIRGRTGLTASVGVSHNKLLAKLASEMNKPDGLTVIRAQEAQRILDPLPVGRLFGIGRKTAARLEEQGIFTLGQLRAAPESVLWPLFGRDTRTMRDRAAGIDERPVVADAPEKQISSEETFETDIRDHQRLYGELAGLAERTAERLRSRELMASQVSIKVRRRDFTTFTRQRSFSPATQETGLITRVATELLQAWFDEQPRVAVRLLGVGVSHLSPAQQLDLFAPGDPVAAGKLDEVVDRIRERFGGTSVKRGNSLE